MLDRNPSGISVFHYNNRVPVEASYSKESRGHEAVHGLEKAA